MGALERKHPLHPAPLRRRVRAANRLMDRAARSPSHCGMGHVGVHARANAARCVRRLEVAVRRGAGALAATR